MLLSARDIWKKLEAHATTRSIHSLVKCENDLALKKNFFINTELMSLDYRAQGVDETTLVLLCTLARECRLAEGIQALISGDSVNQSENKPALHTALRRMGCAPFFVNGQDIMLDIRAVREKMRRISDQLRNGAWLGFSGQPITDVVNIGVGGVAPGCGVLS